MAMQRLVERQKKLIADWKEKHPKECAENPDAYKEADELRAFVIFDDVISDKVAMQWNEFINSFFVEGRHLCISVFITTQHVKGIGMFVFIVDFLTLCECRPNAQRKLGCCHLAAYFPA